MPAFKDENGRGTWFAKFYYTDWTGKRKVKKKRGFSTKREALAFEKEFLNEPLNESSDITLRQLYEAYCQDQSAKLKTSTLATKDNIVQKHILPYFGDKKIKAITAYDIRMWQNEIMGEGFSNTYLRSINSQLSALMNYAVNYCGLPTNPCRKAGLMGEKKADEMLYWTLDEYRKFIDVVKEPRYRVIFDILYWGGLRKGELVALTPNDVFDDGISISKTAYFSGGQLVTTKPKTKKSIRFVTLPEFCIKELRKYISKLYGIKPTDRIFDINSNNAINKRLERYADQAGVKRIRVHDLRHSHASLCVEMGMDILLISERLGHENIETTLSTYSHLYPNKQKMLADLLDKKSKEIL